MWVLPQEALYFFPDHCLRSFILIGNNGRKWHFVFLGGDVDYKICSEYDERREEEGNELAGFDHTLNKRQGGSTSCSLQHIT